MDHAGPLPQILLFLAAAVLVVTLFRRLRLSPVLGYLVGGAVIGPFGLGLIGEVKETAILAEFGVVFLLFIIGTELSFTKMREMRGQVFGYGGAQVLLTGGIIGGLGYALGLKPHAALIIGFGLALSSTALVLQLLSERHARDTKVGRLSLAVLLMQDIAVVPLLVLVPLLGEDQASLGMALLNAGGKAIAAFAIVFIGGRLLLRPLFRIVASLDHAEIFSAFTLLIVLGIAWGFHAAGLSMPLGAFVAGLLVAETEFKLQVEADILPYKGLFLGLFFMVVGMSVDFSLFLTQWPLIIGILLALMGGKAAIMLTLGKLFRYRLSTALATGLVLSQGGEFAFILFTMAAAYTLVPPQLGQVLTVVVVVSMALTPLATLVGDTIVRRVKGARSPDMAEFDHEHVDISRHVLIVGFGRVGQTIGKLLAAEGIPYVALDTDPYIVTASRSRGKPTYYGDCTRREVLHAVSVERARCAVVTVNDFYLANKSVIALKHAAPDVPVIARSSDLKHLRKLEEAGADVAISEMYEGSLQLGGAVLRELHTPDHEISRITELFRERDYALTRANEVAAESPKPTKMANQPAV